MFCKNCGKQLSDTAKFCSGCGTQQNASPVPAQQPQQAADQPQPAQQQAADQPQAAPQQAPIQQQQPAQQQPQAGGVYNPPGVIAIQPNDSFPLLQGEVLFASHYGARFNPVSAAGYMHITNMRVVWTKSLGASMLSHGVLTGALLADEAEIPLDTVTKVESRRVGGSKGGIVIHTGDGKRHLYAVTSKRGTCNAEASASKDIMMTILNYAASVNG